MDLEIADCQVKCSQSFSNEISDKLVCLADSSSRVVGYLERRLNSALTKYSWNAVKSLLVVHARVK